MTFCDAYSGSRTTSEGAEDMMHWLLARSCAVSACLAPVMAHAQYAGYQRNADGSYVVGECYTGYQRNADGSYAVGGLYDGYQRNSDGSYAVGGAYASYQRNPDGTYAVGGAYDGYQRNLDGSYAVGGAYNSYQRNSDGSYALGASTTATNATQMEATLSVRATKVISAILMAATH